MVFVAQLIYVRCSLHMIMDVSNQENGGLQPISYLKCVLQRSHLSYSSRSEHANDALTGADLPDAVRFSLFQSVLFAGVRVGAWGRCARLSGCGVG